MIHMNLMHRVGAVRPLASLTAYGRVVAAFAVVAAFNDAWAADICFQPTAFVSTSTVRLKDVAIVSASDADLMTRLENVALSPAPASRSADASRLRGDPLSLGSHRDSDRRAELLGIVGHRRRRGGRDAGRSKKAESTYGGKTGGPRRANQEG